MQLLILFFKSCIYNLNSRNKKDRQTWKMPKKAKDESTIYKQNEDCR